jgi:hypothetical protein
MATKARVISTIAVVVSAMALGFASSRAWDAEHLRLTLQFVALGPLVPLIFLAKTPRLFGCWDCLGLLAAAYAACLGGILWHGRTKTAASLVFALSLWALTGLYYGIWMWT